MGWDYTEGYTVRQLKNELRESAARNGMRQLAEKTQGKVWYRVLEDLRTGDRFVAVYLTESRKGYGAGYKPMDEDQHPFYYDVPLEFLELAVRKPELQTEGSREWREAVRKRAARETKPQGMRPDSVQTA